jgi:shikimate kinase
MTADIVYFCGGSGSGKSTIAGALSLELSMAHIELDPLFELIDKDASSQALMDTSDENGIASLTYFMLSSLMRASASCIADGAWIAPSKSDVLRQMGGFQPVYFGYPNTTAEARLAQFQRADQGHHWLRDRPDNEVLPFLERQISGAKWTQEQCAQWDIPFVDASDLECGAAAVRALLR